MTRKEYLIALERLELTPSAKRTADALGMSVRAIQRLASGEAPVPRPIAMLIGMYLKHGLPKELRS